MPNYDSSKLFIRPRKYVNHFEIIANYDDGDRVLKVAGNYDEAFQAFLDIVGFRVHSYMSFRSLRLIHPATRRVFFEYRDYRYIRKQDFELLNSSNHG